MGLMMGVDVYTAAWRAAGRSTGPPHARPFALTRGVPVGLPAARNVIYVACVDREASYVGSTTRGVEVRIHEHVRDPERARWEELWLIPLLDDASRYGVLLAEEKVGRLLRPDQNRRPPGR
jgi:hypothetical protein